MPEMLDYAGKSDLQASAAGKTESTIDDPKFIKPLLPSIGGGDFAPRARATQTHGSPRQLPGRRLPMPREWPGSSMNSALVGVLFLFAIVHLLLVAIPIGTTLKAPISRKSKAAWCAFLLLLPFAGAAYFHFRFRSSLFTGKPYDPSPHDLGARNWRDSSDDRD